MARNQYIYNQGIKETQTQSSQDNKTAPQEDKEVVGPR